MHQLNVLKEIIKKIDNVGVEDQQAQQAIINKLEEFTSNYKKEIIKGNGLDSIEKESDRALLNKINSDLLTLFQDSNKNHEFCFEVIKYLSPIIGIKKFFLNWWSIVVTKWLFQDLNNENGNDIIKLILEFLFIETAEDSECPAILYILEFYIVNHQSYSKNESNTQVYNNDVSLLKVQQTSSLSQLDNLYSNLNKIILEYGIVKTKVSLVFT
ncbi:hypothetical protein K502DRAFT_328616 [Neoconidiobolus thromboides FSU 785]|nr:hypothetical protein K502DRAFT_328616 [Neoconidiobolus thromboides FSU 785]